MSNYSASITRCTLSSLKYLPIYLFVRNHMRILQTYIEGKTHFFGKRIHGRQRARSQYDGSHTQTYQLTHCHGWTETPKCKCTSTSITITSITAIAAVVVVVVVVVSSTSITLVTTKKRFGFFLCLFERRFANVNVTPITFCS